jgi:hypothetical protein
VEATSLESGVTVGNIRDRRLIAENGPPVVIVTMRCDIFRVNKKLTIPDCDASQWTFPIIPTPAGIQGRP